MSDHRHEKCFPTRLEALRPDRRAVLAGLGSATLAAAGCPAVLASSPATRRPPRPASLIASPTRLPLVGAPHPDTEVWAYNESLPGPELRFRQGDNLDIEFRNELPEASTVHWHGIRLPNAMDGVPHLTQPPVEPGRRFRYSFALPDAGTYWYHPHQNSSEQVGRGLSGPLIVEEPNPPVVDRDLVWVLSDWRLDRDARILAGFANPHDMSHAGRIGNTVTVNGSIPEQLSVRSGERVRLRLINASNARIFGLEFENHTPTVIAVDGQPISPHAPDGGRIVIGPAMRADIILDMNGSPGSRHRVIDGYYRRQSYHFVELAYADQPLRTKPLESAIDLPPNPLPKPDLAAAIRHEIRLAGGMMMPVRPTPQMMTNMRAGKFWFLNGVAANGHHMEPMATIPRGRTAVFTLINETAWAHPMHLHGYAFQVVSRNGAPLPRSEWRDTVLLEPRDSVEIAFVADNPGDWMFHCHVLEHQMSGMMGVVRVT